jgi:hypothetical protein
MLVFRQLFTFLSMLFHWLFYRGGVKVGCPFNTLLSNFLFISVWKYLKAAHYGKLCLSLAYNLIVALFLSHS